MSRRVMICCAVTGSADTPRKNPAVPVTPEAIARSAIDAAKAGAAVVHIHVRNPETGKPSMELAHYREVVERIRDSGVEVIINLTTGAGGRFQPGADDPREPGPGTTLSRPADRVRHILALRPDICSLDMGSMNMGEMIFANTPGHLAEMAAAALWPRGWCRSWRSSRPAMYCWRNPCWRRSSCCRRPCSRSASASPGASPRPAMP